MIFGLKNKITEKSNHDVVEEIEPVLIIRALYS